MGGESSCPTLDFLCVYEVISLKNEIIVLCLCDLIKEKVSDVINISRLTAHNWQKWKKSIPDMTLQLNL